ncbi:MAG: amino acid ABC transporter ATP-binding protein [Lachnospiraceae bacterium]|nr:amino acid ABC transporter ATP-binding protein [Lachnospiraceae bacterium]
MLEVRGLFKSFGQSEILRGIDLTVEKGDVIAIIGPSGSGKTTLLRCMNYLERADAGQMVFDDVTYDMKLVTKKEILDIRRRTGFVFQNYNLFANKTALKNITEGLTTARKIPAEEARETGLRMLEKVGLAGYEDYYPASLSGGQQQRVAIARAIAPDPEVIYFDEPTSALDPELTKEVLEVMRALAAEGSTMVVVTHEMAFAKNVANKVIFMEGGRIVEAADAETFFAAPAQDRSREFLHGLDY